MTGKYRAEILVGTYLTLLGVFFLICFLGYLRTYLLKATDENNWLVSVAYNEYLLVEASAFYSASPQP